MNDYTLDRPNVLDLAPESVAVNIRKYLDAHRSDPNSATPVVANLEPDEMNLEGYQPRSNELEAPEVRLAIDTLLHHIDPQAP